MLFCPRYFPKPADSNSYFYENAFFFRILGPNVSDMKLIGMKIKVFRSGEVIREKTSRT
jgi:hypothetical protein